MRIVSGSAKGQNIQAPEGLNTRPVTDKIRQALFNIWQFDVPESRFLDLFSGSGSMGLEALSRGAQQVTFVEKGPEAFECIRNNLHNLNVDEKKSIALNMDVLDAIPLMDRQKKEFDLIYIDPPYTQEELYIPVMEAVAKSGILDEDGILAIRAHKDFDFKTDYEGLELFREKKYGISKLYFYRKA